MKARRAPLRGLYAITPETEDTARLVGRAEACLAGGARLLQYRFKHIAPALAFDQALALKAACRAADALFVVNDSIDLAIAVDADGVHVGRDDADARAVRQRMPEAIIGVSCYADPARAASARAAGADYVGIGSMFASSTKPCAVRAPLEAIHAARRGGLPVAAIGGIDLSNAAQVVSAGADMIAVISALFDAPDPRAAASAFAALFSEPRE